MIAVHLYGKLRQYGPPAATDADCLVTVEVREGDTIADVLKRLGMQPAEVVHFFLNHQYSAVTRRVHDGDRLALFGHDMALLYRQYFAKQEE